MYWPHTGVVSLVIDLEEGGVVEAAMPGLDGVCGAAFALNNHPAVHIAVVLYREANISRIGFTNALWGWSVPAPVCSYLSAASCRSDCLGW